MPCRTKNVLPAAAIALSCALSVVLAVVLAALSGGLDRERVASDPTVKTDLQATERSAPPAARAIPRTGSAVATITASPVRCPMSAP